MKLKINTRGYKEVELNIEFPFFRRRVIAENDYEYYKIESESKFSIIRQQMIVTSISTYDDQNALPDFLTSDALNGFSEWSIIEESNYNSAMERLIDKIYRS